MYHTVHCLAKLPQQKCIIVMILKPTYDQKLETSLFFGLIVVQ